MESAAAPDSRLKDRKYGAVKAEWGVWTPAGPGTVTLVMVPYYCVKCGRRGGYATEEALFHCVHLCGRCYADDPAALNGYVVSDEEFRRRVVEEIRAAYGRDLTDAELNEKAARGELSRALRLLERESPYPKYDRDT
jgi:hypothetical protein